MISYNQRETNAEMDYSLKRLLKWIQEKEKQKNGEPSWNPRNQTIDLLQINDIFPRFTDTIEALQLAHDFGDLKHIGTHI